MLSRCHLDGSLRGSIVEDDDLSAIEVEVAVMLSAA